MHYLRRVYIVPRGLEDEVSAVLWAQGTIGVEELEVGTGSAAGVRLEAYYEAAAAPAVDELESATWRCRGVAMVHGEAVPETDWLLEFRRRSQPFELGRGFAVDPGEPGDVVRGSGDERSWLRLPARRAFGIGSHATTRLVVDAMEGMALDGASVLDVGTGTGVLAFVALRLGARRVVAFDLDAGSALIAGQNGRLNALSPMLFAGRLDALRPANEFDLVLVNVLPENLGRDLAGLPPLVAVGGAVLLSGILTERRRQVLENCKGVGLVPVATFEEEEWVAVCLRASGSEAASRLRTASQQEAPQ